MNTITKHLSAFGVTGVAASALLVGGLAAPAQAAEPDRESNTDSSVDAMDAIGTGDNLDAARLGDADLNILTDALTGNTVDAPVDAPVDSSNDAALDGSGDVENTVDGTLGGLNLGSVLGD